MTQLLKRLTLGFGSHHDLTVREFEPCVGLCTDGAEPAWDSLSLLLSVPFPTHSVSLSLSLSLSNKQKKFTFLK